MVGCWDRREEMEPAVTDPEVRASWTDDRDRYWTFLVSVEGDPADALADAAERLAAFNCTRTAPRDYLHATVKQVGFVVDDPSEPDEVSPETADRVADALADAAAFEAELPRLNLFPSVVFCEVRGGRFEDLHRRLLALPDVPEHEHEGDDYASHVTLAEFRGTDDFDGLVGWLERNREVAAGSLAVDAVELVEVDPRETFPALETVRRYELGRASANGDTD